MVAEMTKFEQAVAVALTAAKVVFAFTSGRFDLHDGSCGVIFVSAAGAVTALGVRHAVRHSVHMRAARAVCAAG